ncbi:hypothetical protein JFV29_29445 [Peribacillus sp. TH16]|uniref:hypothetical protein n=1 Tax=Peribacillus sp. TH16 TaxID=2798482 RepID=UPI0019117E95|nr:hypothetical protein [Peribacillus sp. TH16]MBK5485898.1 hypothetical protein [Peribacillus sp. TH16]
MVYQVRLLKGILEPHRSRYQLQNAEAVTRLGWKLLLLYFLSFIVFAVEGYFGVGSESFSKEITKMDSSEFEMGKLLIVGGNIIARSILPYHILIFIISILLDCYRYPIHKISNRSNDYSWFAIIRKGVSNPYISINGYRKRCKSFFIGSYQSVLSQK